jgi:hypothetical protein
MIENDVSPVGTELTKNLPRSLHNVYHKHSFKTVVNNKNCNTSTSFTDRPILGGFFIAYQDLKATPVNLYIHEGCGS